MGDRCYQLDHPSQQTPCFKQVGMQACSKEGCPVYDQIESNTVLKSLILPEDKQSFIECNLLHYICRMSNLSSDNQEFLELTSES